MDINVEWTLVGINIIWQLVSRQNSEPFIEKRPIHQAQRIWRKDSSVGTDGTRKEVKLGLWRDTQGVCSLLSAA